MFGQAGVVLIGYTTQVLGALFLALVLRGVQRYYPRPYLRWWTWSWFALAIYMFGAAVSSVLGPSLPPSHPVRLANAIITTVAGYWQLALLLIGTRTLAGHRDPKWRVVLPWLIATAVAVLPLALLYTEDPSAVSWRFLLRFGIRAGIAGPCFLLTSVRVWQARSAPRGFGRTVVVLAFLAWGLQLVYVAGVAIMQVVEGSRADYVSYFGFMDFGIQAVLGAGMLFWVLEEARAESASAEAGQARARSALQVTTDRYRELFERAHDIVYSHDAEGRLIAMNPAGKRTLGYSLGDMGRLRLQDIVTPDEPDVVERLFARVITDGVIDATFIALDGRRVPLEVRVQRAVRDGRVVEIQGIARDASERRLLEERLRRAHKLEAVGRLAGGVAHDFNNLLSAIIGYADLLAANLGKGEMPASAREDLQEIRGAAQRAAGLTRRLLSVSGRRGVQTDPIEVDAVIGAISASLSSLIGDRGTLEVSLGAPGLAARLDREQFEQALLDLILNARDALPASGARITITTAPHEMEERHTPGLLLIVTDNGRGMDQETLDRLFEPFFSTKGAGHGIGLSLAALYGAVQAAGGEIRVESALGQGTTLRVWVPSVVPEASTAATADAIPRSARVLVVDDEPSVRALAASMLRRSGYDAEEAGSAAEAIAIWRGAARPFDLLLTDVVMPESTGPELADCLRELHPGLCVLFMSAYLGHPALKHLPDNPEKNDRVLGKPFTTEALLKAVSKVLGIRNLV